MHHIVFVLHVDRVTFGTERAAFAEFLSPFTPKTPATPNNRETLSMLSPLFQRLSLKLLTVPNVDEDFVADFEDVPGCQKQARRASKIDGGLPMSTWRDNLYKNLRNDFPNIWRWRMSCKNA